MLKLSIKFLFIPLCLLIYLSYNIWAYDNRSANNLSAYCNIDFKGVQPSTETLGATLELVDYRYSSKPLEPTLTIYVDDNIYQISNLKIKQINSDYSLAKLLDKNFAKNEYHLFAEFPLQILKNLKTAKKVQIGFNYHENRAILLPLSAIDLKYWQNQLTHIK